MNLEKLVAVSSLPGIYRMVGNRNNGLIVEDIDTGKRKFAPSRKHQFTPMETVAIYTDDGDSTELKNVFQSMLDQFEDNPPVSANASSAEIKDYFADVLPTYDPDRVFVNDMKKVIKWFGFLNDRKLLESEVTEEETTEKEAEADESADTAE